MLQLYGNPRAMRCLWMLEEVGEPYQLIEKSIRADDLQSAPLPSSRSGCGSRPLSLRRLAGSSALFQKPDADLFAVDADQLASAVGDAVRCKQQEKFLEVEAFNTA